MRVWVLFDDKVGSSKQSVALAEILECEYEIKKISYTSWVKFPNCFPFLDSLILDKKTKEALSEDKPDLIIGAGRRIARVLSFLKRKYPKCKVIQILKPDMPLKIFDVVVLPHHDNIKLSQLDNRRKIIRVNGAVVKYNSAEVEDARNIWAPIFERLNKPKIALLIGGNSKSSKMQKKHAMELAKRAIELAVKLKASILVTNSRRTDKEVSSLIFEEIKASGINNFIYDASKEDANSVLENPYKGYLACADYIIVTGDSISMCVESISMGKPVIVYAPKAIMSQKHWRFIEQLVSDGQVNLLKGFSVNSVVLPKNTDDNLKKNLLDILRHDVGRAKKKKFILSDERKT